MINFTLPFYFDCHFLLCIIRWLLRLLLQQIGSHFPIATTDDWLLSATKSVRTNLVSSIKFNCVKPSTDIVCFSEIKPIKIVLRAVGLTWKVSTWIQTTAYMYGTWEMLFRSLLDVESVEILSIHLIVIWKIVKISTH